MLITKFNRMIRSRVLWTIIAVGASASLVGFIGPRYGCRDRGNPLNREGKLFGQDVSPQEFATARFFELGLRDDNAPKTEEAERALRERVWKRIAVLRLADRLGLMATDAEVQEALRRDPAFQVNGAFNKQRFEAVVQTQLRIPVDLFATYVRQTLTIRKLINMFEAVTWTAPAELQRRLANLTDNLALEYVLIPPDPARDRTEVTAAEAERFYDAYPDLFRVPEQVNARYVAFPLPAATADAEIPDAELSAYYDEHLEDYSVTDTNGLTVSLPFAEVREDILAAKARALALEKAKDAATDFSVALAPDRAGHAPDFDALAATQKLAVHTSGFFTATQLLAGIDAGLEFNRAAFALDPDDPERNVSDGIVGSNAVYVVAALARRQAYVPPFQEIAAEVLPAAATNAQQQAFLKRAAEVRRQIQDLRAAGKSFAEAVRSLGFNVATTAPFTVYDSLNTNVFEYAEALVPKVATLEPGDVTEPVPVPEGALIAHVAARTAGDFTTIQLLTPELVRTLSSYRSGLVFEDWAASLLAEGRLEDTRRSQPASDAEESEPASRRRSPAADHAGDLL